MVAPAVRVFGQVPVVCEARPLLFKAQAALERGALIESGCLLREAIRRYALAECKYWGCLPPNPKQRQPRLLIKALTSCTAIKGGFGAELLIDALEISNKLAHVQHVRQEHLERVIVFVHLHLDAATYLVQPSAGGRS